MSHDWQQRNYGEQWPIGERRREPVPTGFSETKKCDFCKKTKNWKLFVIGADSKKSECRECYRKRILPPKEDKKKTVDIASLLESGHW
jgi:hypothetical protein